MSTTCVITLFLWGSLSDWMSLDRPSWFISHSPRNAPLVRRVVAVARPIPDALPMTMKTLLAIDDAILFAES